MIKRIMWFILLGWWMESLAWLVILMFDIVTGIIPALDAIGERINKWTGAKP